MDDGPVRPRALRVASVPTGHAYVRHLDDPASPLVERLPDPLPPRAAPGRWWPHAALEPAWVRENADAFDVLHLHFGFEHRTPAELEEWVAVLAAVGRPLVLTVHDLENPHLVDQGPHAARLAVLVRAAAAVLTLTPGAAREVRRRWGRTAPVVRHPHVAPLSEVRRPREVVPGGPVVGVHLKDVRANVDLAVLDPLRAAVSRVPQARLRVSCHRSGLDRLGSQLHRSLSSDGRVDLVVHDPWDDDALLTALRRLDVLVLPYAHGTHSGMVELCHDLGTAVVASDRGWWHEQQAVSTYVSGASGPDPLSVQDALRDALSGPVARATVRERLRQRRDLAVVHRDVYAAAIAGAASRPAGSAA